MGFEPSADTNPVWLSYLLVLLTTALFYLRRKESFAERKAKEVKKEHLIEGLKLILEDVEKKDAAHERGSQRETELPESSRVFSFLFDEVLEQPVTYLGIAATHQHMVAAGALFNRSFTVEARKAKEFTEKAIEVKNFKLAPSTDASESAPLPVKLERFRSGHKSEEELAFETWVKEKETSKKEVMSFLSGEKLDAVLAMEKKVVKSLGQQLFSSNNRELLRQISKLSKRVHEGKRAAMAVMKDILSKAIVPFAVSVVVSQVHPYLWFQYDRIVTGKLIQDAMDGNMTWNSAISTQKAIDVAVLCACWHFTNVVSDIILQDAKRRFTRALKSRFIECLMHQDFEYFEVHGIGDLQARLNSDVDQVTQSLLQLPYQLSRTILGFLGSLVYTCQIVPYDLVLAAMLPLAIIAPTNQVLRRYISKQEEKLRKINENAMSGTMDAILNIEVVRGFATEREEICRYRQAGDIMAAFESSVQVWSGFSNGLIAFFFTANLGILSYLCAQRVSQGTIKIEDCGVFLIQIGLHATGRLMSILDMIPQVQKMMNPLYRVIDHLGAESKIEPNPAMGMGARELTVTSLEGLKEMLGSFCWKSSHDETKSFFCCSRELVADNGERVSAGSRLAGYLTAAGEERPAWSQESFLGGHFPIKLLFRRGLMPSHFEGNIDLRNVMVTYPRDLRNQIYKGESFSIKKGQKIGICGAAGCGKTTGFGLLQRLYDVDPSGGPILIDGVDIREYDVHYLRERIAIVQQKCVLFKTNVRENILYGMKTFPDTPEGKQQADRAVIAALKLAQAWEFIESKPDKLLTMVSETGGGFSGGQKQRLAIARVLIRNPDVILLDEATAALDPVNERAVQDTLDSVMKDYTVIAVAHRLTTIKDSDKIIVLDSGRVVEEGTHDELLKIPIAHEDGGKRQKTGFYRVQWETQFKEKGLSSNKLREKVQLLRDEIALHKAKIHRTNMAKWRATAHMSSLGKYSDATPSTTASEDSSKVEFLTCAPEALSLDRFYTPVSP